MYATLERPPAKPIDWLQAKTLYLQDNTLSYADIARLFGVSLKQVKKHGSRNNWVEGRQEVSDNVEIAIKEKTVDQRVEINDKHRKSYASIQAIINTYLIIINNHNIKVLEEAKAKDELPNPKDLYSPMKLFYLVKTMRQAIEGERVTVDLPNIIVAPAGWTPPEPLSDEEQEAKDQLNEMLAKAGINLST